MREILFRGFNKKNNQWLYGFYLRNRGAHFVCPDEFAVGKSWEDYEVDPYTVGQYTGLLDKNGTKIFEGDIVEYQYVICEEDGVGVYESPVTFENGCFCIDGDSEFTLSYAIWSSDEYGGLTVIGNIFDSNLEGNK